MRIDNSALNGICPYFTMFPLEFPYRVLRRHGRPGEWTLDPFSGRGTTAYASRLLGFPTIAVDSSPVAVALSEAKLANTTPARIRRAAMEILEEFTTPREMPGGEFWEWAFDPHVLRTLCRLRDGLLADCRSSARKALRAILLGALHGPRAKATSTHLSNQAPRSYAPKPGYAVRFWRARNLRPPPVDVLEIVERRAQRYYTGQPRAIGRVIRGDSREARTFGSRRAVPKPAWIITSPPYYGMRTYIPDQWLRHWLLGGAPHVEYTSVGQLSHGTPEGFAHQLGQVWQQVARVSTSEARLVIRFGGINDRRANPLDIIKLSLAESGWRILTTCPAGSALSGRRQAAHFAAGDSQPIAEVDVWARRA